MPEGPPVGGRWPERAWPGGSAAARPRAGELLRRGLPQHIWLSGRKQWTHNPLPLIRDNVGSNPTICIPVLARSVGPLGTAGAAAPAAGTRARQRLPLRTALAREASGRRRAAAASAALARPKVTAARSAAPPKGRRSDAQSACRCRCATRRVAVSGHASAAR